MAGVHIAEALSEPRIVLSPKDSDLWLQTCRNSIHSCIHYAVSVVELIVVTVGQ